MWGTAIKVSKNQLSHLQNERFARDFFQKSCAKTAKRAFCARLPPKVTRLVSKMHISYETSSKRHASSLQNERFVRDFLQKKSRVKVSKTSILKVKLGSPSEHTHQAALPSSFAIPAPPNNARSHANRNVTATFTSTTTRNLTIPCACHENLHFHAPQNPHKVLRLPRKVSISYHVGFNNIPHHTFGMISTRSEHASIHQYHHFSGDLSRKHSFDATP